MMGKLHVNFLFFVAIAMLSAPTLAEEDSSKEKTKPFDFDYLISFINPFAKLPRTGHEANEHSLFYYFGLAEKPVISSPEEAFRNHLAQDLAWPEDIWKPKGMSNIALSLYQWSDSYLKAHRQMLFPPRSQTKFGLKTRFQQWAFPSPVKAWVSASYIDLYSGPNENYPAFYIAEKHQAITLIKTQADWVKVRVEDGSTGWVKDQNLLTRIVFHPANTKVKKGTENNTVQKSAEPKQFIQFGLHSGILEAKNTLKVSTLIPLFENFFIGASLGEVIEPTAEAQFLEIKLQHQPDFHLPVQAYFSLGGGHIFNASHWADISSNSNDARFISIEIGISYPLSPRLSLNLDATNYHAFFSDTYTASLQGYNVGIRFQGDNQALAVLEKSANKALRRENRMLGVYIGQYETELGYSALITGLSFIYFTSPNSFIETSWGQGDLNINQLTSGSISYYRFTAAYIAHRNEYVIRGKSLRSKWYVLAGPGATRYIDQSIFTANFGVGLLIETEGALAIKIQTIDQIVDDGLLENDGIAHNPELSVGAALRF
ncbi:MAG: SH3 domain-containing protein [Pseudomonadales bacterium]|nr:SH3 domain-containing protein [Pseudomonadales bacterium]